jgi:hypothetical protein
MSPSDNEEKTNTRGEPTLRRSSSVFGSRTPRLQMIMPASIRKSTNVKTTQPKDSKSSDSSDATDVQRSMIAELKSLRSEMVALRERSARLEETVATTPHTLEYTQTGMYEADGTPRWGVPKIKDMELQLANFSARETHKGLGTGVNEWVNRYVRQLERDQVASGYCWPEDVKMDVLEDHLEGKALGYWQIKRDSWSGLKLEHAMEALKRNYKCTLSDRQAMAHFDKEKPTYRGYTEHLNYLLKVNAHFDRNVLKSMVHRSGADLIHEISSKYDRNRTNYINHATELAEFADELWSERNLDKSTARSNRGGSVVNAVVSKRPEMHDCYNCGRKGHLSKDCPTRKVSIS